MLNKVNARGLQKEGQESSVLDRKSDDTAIKQAEDFAVGSKGEQVPKQTARGWKLLVRLKDNSTSWIELKDLTLKIGV